MTGYDRTGDEKFGVLLDRARRFGGLTTQDIMEVFPVQTMSANELAMLVLRLEDAGVPLELEDELIGGSRRREPTAPAAPAINLPGAQQPGRNERQPAPAPGLAPDAHRGTEPVQQAAPAGDSGWTFVVIAGLLVALGALGLLFLSR